MTPSPSGIARVAAVPRIIGDPWMVWIEDGLMIARLASDCTPHLQEHDLVFYTKSLEGPVPILITALSRRPLATARDTLRWRTPDTEGRTRLWCLRSRDRIERMTREWFAEQGFLHIAAPVCIRYPNPEPQFDITPAGDGCLITSPELQLKRLLVGGFERIYSLVSCFRGGESDRTHNPEFTMLEWYRTGAGLSAMQNDLEKLLSHLVRGLESPVFPPPPWPRVTVAEMVASELELDIRGCIKSRDLWTRGRAAGFFDTEQKDEPFEVLFSRLWSRFEAGLGRETPVFITGWPLPLASLAAVDPDDPSTALRMELVYQGVELANGFAELTDPDEQQRRMDTAQLDRRAAGKPHWDADPRFLKAIRAGLPESAGMALGFERLCMLLLGVESITSVLPFSWEEL